MNMRHMSVPSADWNVTVACNDTLFSVGNQGIIGFCPRSEAQYSSPLLFLGKPVTAKVEGKEVAARLIASGTWELDGDQLRVRITQTNQPSAKFDTPWEYQVISSTDKKLVLQHQGGKGELVAMFREE